MKRKLLVGLGVSALALGLRLPLLRNPRVWRANGDAVEYLRLARTDSLMNDKRPPGYPLFLKLIGQDSLLSPKVQTLIACAASGALWFAEPWASAAAALSPGHVGYSPVLIPDVIFGLLLFLLFWLLVKLPPSKAWAPGLLAFLAFALKPVGFYMGLLAPVVKRGSWKRFFVVFLPLSLILAGAHRLSRGGSVVRANYGVWKTVLWRARLFERKSINEKMGVVESIRKHPFGVAGAVATGGLLVAFGSNAPILAWETGRVSGELYGIVRQAASEGLGVVWRSVGPWLVLFPLEAFFWLVAYLWGIRRAVRERGWRFTLLLPLGFYFAASAVAGAPRLRVGVEPLLLWWAFGRDAQL